MGRNGAEGSAIDSVNSIDALQALVSLIPKSGPVSDAEQIVTRLDALERASVTDGQISAQILRAFMKARYLEPLEMAAALRAALRTVPKDLLRAKSLTSDALPALTDEQQLALAMITTGSGPFFVTGRAGTGKSVLLRHLTEKLSKQRGLTLVLAPTGVAARNAGGWTLHRVFLDMAHDVFIPAKDEWKYIFRNEFLISQISTLIIDEASMVRADAMDRIDRALRKYKNNFKPFGGVKLVLFGDLAQLPPILEYRNWATNATRLGSWVMAGYEQSDPAYFFMAHCFVVSPITVVELTKNLRQRTDSTYIELLERVRNNSISTSDQELIREADLEIESELGYFLCPYRKDVEAYNQKRLDQLDTPLVVFEKQDLVIHDTERYDEESFDEETAAPMLLELKVGAQVMFVRNSLNWQNGTLGKVTRITNDSIYVETDDGEFKVFRELFDQTYPELIPGAGLQPQLIAEMWQFPLMLAWAVSVHKSQGLTLARATIDFRRSFFAPGQAYVALSRCTKLDNLSRVGQLNPEIALDYPPSIQNFFEEARTQLSFEESQKRVEARWKTTGKALEILENFVAQGAMPDDRGFDRKRQFNYLAVRYDLNWFSYIVHLNKFNQDGAEALVCLIDSRT